MPRHARCVADDQRLDAGENHLATPGRALRHLRQLHLRPHDREWSYALDQNLADPLTAGQSVTDTLTVHSADGTASQDIIVNITGANDAASIGVVSSGDYAVTEAGGTANATAAMDASGQLRSATSTPARTFRDAGSLSGTYGTFTFDTDDRRVDLCARPEPGRSADRRRSVTDTLTVTLGRRHRQPGHRSSTSPAATTRRLRPARRLRLTRMRPRRRRPGPAACLPTTRT